jgi:integrase/recombinase XerD
LEPEEVRSIIDQIKSRSPSGVRDRALLLFLYNTGARVSEALSVRPCDLHLQRPREVRLLGKGGRERTVPLWKDTAAVLRQAIRPLQRDDEPVFRNNRGMPLSRDGAAYVISKYVVRASGACPRLARCHVTPHVLRHSCAVGLLQSGVDIAVIRDYLGHASVATTSRYIKTNLKMKRAALDAFWKRAGLESRRVRPWRASPKLIEFLSSL